MECLNCGTEIIQTPKKKERIFCNSTCRSNYWQKTKRLESQNFSAEQIIKKIKESWKPKETIPTKPIQEKPKGKQELSSFWKERFKQKNGLK